MAALHDPAESARPPLRPAASLGARPAEVESTGRALGHAGDVLVWQRLVGNRALEPFLRGREGSGRVRLTLQRELIGPVGAQIDTDLDKKTNQKAIRLLLSAGRYAEVRALLRELDTYIDDNEFFEDKRGLAKAYKEWIEARQEWKKEGAGGENGAGAAAAAPAAGVHDLAMFEVGEIPFVQAAALVDQRIAATVKNTAMKARLITVAAQMREFEAGRPFDGDRHKVWVATMADAQLIKLKRPPSRAKKTGGAAAPPHPSGAAVLDAIGVTSKFTRLADVTYGGGPHRTHLSCHKIDSLRAAPSISYEQVVNGLHITVEHYAADDPRNPKWWIGQEVLSGHVELNRSTKDYLSETGSNVLAALDQQF